MKYPRRNRPEKKKHNIVPLKPRTGTLNKNKKQVFVRDMLKWLQLEVTEIDQHILYTN